MDYGTFDFDLSQVVPWGPSFELHGELGLALSTAVLTSVIAGALFCAMKGKYGILLLAILAPGPGTVLSVICGYRRAKPRSFWASHMYDREAMAKSIDRYEPPIDLESIPPRKRRKNAPPLEPQRSTK